MGVYKKGFLNWDCEIGKCKLPFHVRMALIKKRVRSFEDLGKFSLEELGQLKGVGPKFLLDIQALASGRSVVLKSDQKLSRKEKFPEVAKENPTLEKYILTSLETVSEREGAVLKLRYGLGGDVPKTLTSIGREFRLSRERIRQIEAAGLRKLRHQSRKKYFKPALDILKPLWAEGITIPHNDLIEMLDREVGFGKLSKRGTVKLLLKIRPYYRRTVSSGVNNKQLEHSVSS